jgi:hypothetical protein
LRLYDRRHARWAGRYVHESIQAEGEIGRLSAELEHHPYHDVSHHLRTIERYSGLAARQMFEDGRRTGPCRIVLHADAAFLRNYFLRGGVKDGTAGLIVSVLNSYYVAMKFVKLWELCSTSHIPDAARAWRGGQNQVLRDHRRSGAQPPRVLVAPGGRTGARASQRGPRPHPPGAGHEVDFAAAFRFARVVATCRPTSSTPPTRTRSRWRRWPLTIRLAAVPDRHRPRVDFP